MSPVRYELGFYIPEDNIFSAIHNSLNQLSSRVFVLFPYERRCAETYAIHWASGSFRVYRDRACTWSRSYAISRKDLWIFELT
jgi:hypothetical protein